MAEHPQAKKVSKRSLQVRRVRGMQDFLPAQAASMARIARVAEDVARLYGFERIATPILEQAKLFRRSLGLGSDVVMKEMYAFTDKNDEELCLRPEGTAGAIRALIDGGLTQTLPQKWFYDGPMFRRERPQRGRFRQFHQCGVEFLHRRFSDITGSYNADMDVLFCAWHFMQRLGLAKKVALKVNWLGRGEERDDYNDRLLEYFQEYAERNELSPESMERLKRGNPMRIFDSKDPRDKKAIAQAPSFPFANEEYENIFKEQVTNRLGIPFTIERTLVRGLDYYDGLVFEFVEKDSGREQATVLAGGRYDGLCEQIGGHPVCAVGWAVGLERLANLVADPMADLVAEPQQQIIKFCFIGFTYRYYDIRNKIYEELLPFDDKRTVFLMALTFSMAGREGYDYGIAIANDENLKNIFCLEKLYPKKENYSGEYDLSGDELIAKIKAIVDAQYP